MQSAIKNDNRSLHIITILLILLHFLINIFADNRLFTLVTSLITWIGFILLCRFWIDFVIPGDYPVKKLTQLPILLWGLSTSKEPILSIKNGKCQQDYFLLKKAPKVSLVYIHQDSAALVQKSDNDLRLLASGFNTIKKGEKIVLTFSQNMQYFNFGPMDSENPFNTRRSGESYTDFHARQLRAEKVKSQTKDGIVLFPSFRIFYQLVSPSGEIESDQWSTLSRIGLQLRNTGLRGEARDHINEQIGRDICKIWNEQVSQLSLSDMFSTSGNHNLSGIMDSINRQFSNQASPDVSSFHKKGNKFSSVTWALPLIKIYLQDLSVQKIRSDTNE